MIIGCSISAIESLKENRYKKCDISWDELNPFAWFLIQLRYGLLQQRHVYWSLASAA